MESGGYLVQALLLEASGEQLSPIIPSTALSFPDYILYQQFVCGKNQSCQGLLPGCALCVRCPITGARAFDLCAHGG